MIRSLCSKGYSVRGIFMSLLLMVLTSITVFAQDKQVSGKVFTQEGTPLPDISVSIKGTSKGTTTGADGSFSIAAPANATLVFSGVGFTEQEAKAGSGALSIKLARDV